MTKEEYDNCMDQIRRQTDEMRSMTDVYTKLNLQNAIDALIVLTSTYVPVEQHEEPVMTSIPVETIDPDQVVFTAPVEPVGIETVPEPAYPEETI